MNNQVLSALVYTNIRFIIDGHELTYNYEYIYILINDHIKFYYCFQKT